MAQAYDFALDKMGLDIQSNGLWTDYINFLKVGFHNLMTKVQFHISGGGGEEKFIFNEGK